LWKTFTAHKAHLISSVSFHEAKPVKIALIGYGKMGMEVEQVARKGGHVIAARIDPASDVAVTSEISSQTIGSANVCIEFTHPEAAFGNIEKVVRLQKPLVVGTTGWYQHLRHQEIVLEKASCLCPQLFFRVNLFYRVAAAAAWLFIVWE
jgi:4-hydroxy-tetrahydrodipicolinate reductase